MKDFGCILALVFIVFGATAQETWQSEVGGATVWLTGDRMVGVVRSRDCLSYAAIHSPSTSGADGPVIISFNTRGCFGNAVQVYRGELNLTSEQIEQLQAGLWYLLLDDTRS